MDLLSLTSKFSSLSSRIRRSSGDIERSTYQLSSGNRIASAGQDVASLSVATRLKSSLAGMRTAANSLSQANSLLQIADGGLNQIGGMLERIHQISLMGANGAISNTERNYLNIELMQLMAEVDRTALGTKFSGINVIHAPKGQSTLGTQNPDTILGGAGADTVNAYEGDDLIYVGRGDDVIQGGVNSMIGLRGSVYTGVGGLASNAQVNTIINSTAPTATFTASSVNYPNSGGVNISTFLGADGASLTNPAVGLLPADQMILVFEGTLNVPADGTYTFNVGSDDGFELQIDGVVMSQFPSPRGFSFTNANLNLTEGPHDIRLVFWENLGGQGLVVNSNMFASNIMDDTATEFRPDTDGNDTVYGGIGNDVVELSGTRLDYSVTELPDGGVLITDNRPDRPNGIDTLYNVERLRFSDGEEMSIASKGGRPGEDVPTTLRFNVVSNDGKTFDYDVVDASTASLFDDASKVDVSTLDKANASIDMAGEAIRRLTQMRAYVGSKQSQAGILEDVLRDRALNTDNARGVLTDTNVAEVTTEYALQRVRREAGINVAAQSQILRFDAISTIMDSLGQEV